MMSGQAPHTEAHFLLSMFEVAAVAVELPVIVGPVIRCRRHVLALCTVSNEIHALWHIPWLYAASPPAKNFTR